MPVPSSPVELIDWLESKQMLPPAQAAELRPLLPHFPDTRLLARELIRRDWLSPYQVNQILQDKGDQLVLGWLRLRERLGEGAMGQVFKAWNIRLERVVAVKTVNKDLVSNTRAQERFRQEIEAAAQLEHPNIVRIRNADEIDSRPFMVMDYVDGPNLADLVKAQGPLPIPLAAECGRQTAWGLQHAFERGVVHRDVKPANLLIEKNDGGRNTDEKNLASFILPPGNFQVKILDFGLARFDSDRRNATRLTQIGSTLGTVDYMAPEQAESARDADTRADIYGLGCTLFFLLTGKTPFPGASIAAKVGARLSGPPPSVRAARPDVPEELDLVVRRMMARQPADRYQTPAEVAAALKPFTVPATEVPHMEIDDRIPLAAPVTGEAGAPVALALPVEAATPGLEAPLAAPVGAPPEAPLAPAHGGFFPPGGDNPFGTSNADTAGADTPHAGGPRAGRQVAQAGMDRRVIIGLAAGAAMLLVTVVACSGYIVVGWLGGAPKLNNTLPAGADLQISEAFLSSFDGRLPMGRKMNVIVKIHRVKFDEPVEVRLENLPAGVTTEKRSIRPGSIAVEVPITASFGIDPVDTEIRVVASVKNLTMEKTIPLHVVPEKTKPRGP